MRKARNIFLIGPMGAGKTTVGRQLAKALNIDFYDSDREIELHTGVDIPMIFDYEGEEGFRQREEAMISGLTQLDPIILATGGGVVLRQSNRENLTANGFVVYLQCRVERQFERTYKDSHRPLLNTANPRDQLKSLMQIREPLYRSCANFSVDTGRISTRKAVKTILGAFRRYNHGETET